MFYAPAQLARRTLWSGFVMLRMRRMQTTWALTLYVKRKALFDIGGLTDIEAWIWKLCGPPISIFNVNSHLIGTFQDDDPV